jgi:type IV secretory pathway VirB2 component (pilin)
MIALPPPTTRRQFAFWRWPRQTRQSVTLFTLLVLFPALALAQSGTPFDTGFTNLQTLFTGTIAKVASLIAIVIGGYQFAHGEPGAKNSRFAYVAVSRASFEARIFTDDASRLPARLSTEIDKTTALDFAQAVGKTPLDQSLQSGIQVGM